MKRNWQLQEAKNRLSELVSQAREAGPQTITLRGKPAAVLLSIEDYRNVTQRRTSLLEFFLHSPLRGSGLKVERLPDPPRKIAL